MDELELEESLPATTIYAEDGDPIEAHRTDDPNVWGLVDVARGRTPSAPTTIYNIAGDSASGVAGVLFPDNNFLPALDSQVGTSVIVGDWYGMKPVYHEPVVALEIAWDGAAKSPLFENEDGELVREHSKGILLGDYAIMVVGVKSARPFASARGIPGSAPNNSKLRFARKAA